MNIWVVEFKWDTPRLAEVEIEKETDKTFIIKRARNILDSIWLSKRVSKKTVRWFRTQEEAVDWLIQQQEKNIARHQIDIIKGQEQLEQLNWITNRLTRRTQ